MTTPGEALQVSGTVKATAFKGDGSSLTNLPEGALGAEIDSGEITDGTIVNADINNSAAIAASKLSGPVTGMPGHGLAPVATSGSYDDLSNKPAIGYSSPIAAGDFTQQEVDNLRAGKLDDGTAPWTGFQPADDDLTDLSDGFLSGSKIGIGIDAGNITTGTLSSDRFDALSDLGGGSGATFLRKDGTWAAPQDTDTQLGESTVEGYIANDVTTGYLPYDNGTKLTDSGIFYGSGKIGIGTTTPATKLEVSGTSTPVFFTRMAAGNGANANALGLQRDNSIAAANDQVGVHFSLRDVGGTYWNAAGLRGIITDVTSGAAIGGLILATKGSGDTHEKERVRIDGSGSVGIGTTSPMGQLHAFDTSGLPGIISEDAQNNVSSANIYFNKSRLGGDTNNGDYVGVLVFRAHDGSAYRSIGDIRVQLDSNSSDQGHMQFRLAPGGAGDTRKEYMRITKDGNIGIGTMTPSRKVHIALDSGTIPPETGAGTVGLLISNNDAVGDMARLALIGGTSGTCNIYFGDENDENAGTINYNHASDRMTFRAGGSGTHMVIDSTGNVGIGTTTPSQKLDVNGTVKAASFMGNGSQLTGITAPGSAFGNHGSAAANSVYVSETSNVGIGTTSPMGQLHTYDTSGLAGFISEDAQNNMSGGTIQLNKSRLGGDTNNWDYVGGIVFRAHDGSAYRNIGDIRVQLDSDNSDQGHMEFRLAPGGAGDTRKEYMRITKDGNVGIGTTSPEVKLHLFNPSNIAEHNTLKIENDAATWSSYLQLDSITNQVVEFRDSGVRKWLLARDYNDKLHFMHGGWGDSFTKLTLLNNGNIGIGTTTPGELLHMAAGASTPTRLRIQQDTDDNNEADIQFRKSRDNGIVQDGDGVGNLFFMAHDGTDTQNWGAIIGAEVDGAPASDDVPMAIKFWTGGTGSPSRMIIKNNGNVGIGIGMTAPSEALQVSGTVKATAFVGDGSQLTGITSPGSAFGNHASAGANSVYVSDNSYVGIGTTSPDYDLHVETPNTSGERGIKIANDYGSLLLQSGVGPANSFVGKVIGTAGGDNTRIGLVLRGQVTSANDTGTMPVVLIDAQRDDGTDITERPLLQVGNNHNMKMTVDKDGKLGIGTTSPGYDVHLVTESDTTFAAQHASNNTGSGGFIGLKARGTTAAPSAPLAGDHLITFAGGGYDGSGFVINKGVMFVDAAENWGAAAKGTRITFETTENGGTARTEKMRIADSGKVGIGTTTPASLLDVAGTIFSSSAVNPTFIGREDSSNYAGFGWHTTQNYGRFYTREAGTAYDPTMVMKAGNVGIGTSSPASKLDVNGNVEADGFTINGVPVGTSSSSYWSNSGGDIYYNSGKVGINTTAPTGGLDISNGAKTLVLGADNGANTRTNATEKNARLLSYHYTNSEVPFTMLLSAALAAENKVSVGGGTTHGNAATSIHFFTAADTTTTVGTERMTIGSSGNVAIGTTSMATRLNVVGTDGVGSVAQFAALRTNGPVYLQLKNTNHTNNWAYGVWEDGSAGLKLLAGGPTPIKMQADGTVSGTFGTYHTASDRRLKKDVETIPDALGKVAALRGVNFRWKKDSESGRLKMGMIAQEVEKVVPEAVHTADDEMQTKAVEYQYMVGLLVEAIKELKAKNDALKSENKELKSGLENLIARIEALEK